jgi:hypothetical protein
MDMNDGGLVISQALARCWMVRDEEVDGGGSRGKDIGSACGVTSLGGGFCFVGFGN